MKSGSMNWDGVFERVVHYLPARFQQDRMPYLFGLVVLLVIALVLVAVVTPYNSGVPVPLAFAVVLLVLLMAYSMGMPLALAVQFGVAAGLMQVTYAGWVSGGIFSPRLAWYTPIPLVAFYALSRRAGLFWLCVVLALLCGLSYATWHGWLPSNPPVGLAQVNSSFASNTVAMLLTISVVFVYDSLYRKAYRERLDRRAQLEERRQELLRAAALREQFIATVSHELRTPMNAILGFNTMLLGRVKEQEQALKILNHTRQSAEHLMTVINDVLDYSQLQAGKIKVQFETFALHDTVNNAFGLFSPREQSMNLKYHLDIADDVPQWVHTDRHRLMQVLVNLLGNAIKFTHQGYVSLQVQKVAEGVKFSVQDTGIGIEDAQKQRIFERFAQAGGEIQARYGGNGLGLSITRRLVALMGGQIGFVSTAGQGSTFWFTLPLDARDAPLPQESEPQKTPTTDNTSPRHFLVVDDHPLNRLLAKKVLLNAWPNSLVVEAEDGAQALEALQKNRFDVVLMDMVMPQMDGIEATSAMRNTLPSPVCDTPVMGLTANVNPQDLERFKAAGLNAVMLKPFEPAQLYAQIEALIRADSSVEARKSS
jgi:signal transduction histidine kinase/CheY-like chemotaxis protein